MMNNGGMLVNSMGFRNASPGVQVRNGLGGGVYILGNGTVFRTVITNNTARVAAVGLSMWRCITILHTKNR